MYKIIAVIIATIFITGCSVVPKDPRMSFGKKCNVNEDGSTVSSYVWIYGKDGGLSATKELCK
tara:strand:- start:177 stop:365 length:189 start_codon:yes stop_codon:yes gene_type:complete